jgi:hypothetical protein
MPPIPGRSTAAEKEIRMKKVSINDSPASRNNLRAAAARLAQTRLLLLRSGATGAEEIAQNLALHIAKIEGLNTGNIGGVQ